MPSPISLLRCDAVSAHASSVVHAEPVSVFLRERFDLSDQLAQEI